MPRRIYYRRASLAGAVVAAGLIWLALALGIALAGLHRLTAHIQALGVIAWFWWFRGDPLVLRWLKIGALASAGPVIALAAGLAQKMRPALHGRARWADEADVRRAGLRSRKGIILGRKNGRLLVFGGSEHVLVYAPTRTGKGVGVVIPNLLNWPDSVVVLDIKRENFEASAGFRAAHGQRALLFDPLDPEGRTARYNPLGHIDRTDPVQVMDELQKIAVMLFPVRERTDAFWAETARGGFIGVGAYVAETPDMSFNLGTIFAELTRGDPKSRLLRILDDRARDGPPLSDGCIQALKDFCTASDNTFASIKQTITSRLNLFLNPRVRAATSATDFDFGAFRRERISLYLCVSPNNLQRIAPLYNLLLQQLIDRTTERRPHPKHEPYEILVLLDEFARLGHAPVIASAFAYIAGYGLRLLPVLQSPAQLRAEYGRDVAEEIIANCGVEVVFAPKEIHLAQALSERLGYWTYGARSMSRPAGLSGGRRSTTESEQRRALLLPQELTQLGRDQLIVLCAGVPPILGEKIAYYRERAFARRVRPAPTTPPHAGRPCQTPPLEPYGAASATAPGEAEQAAQQARRPSTLAEAVAVLVRAGLKPAPTEEGEPADHETWLDGQFDKAAQLSAADHRAGRETDEARGRS